MKALTVRQPWANMIASGEKPIETRTWYTKYRGPLLIHSSKKPDIYPAQSIIAVVTLLDCRRMVKEDEKEAKCPIRPRAYSFVLGKLWKLPKPIKMVGALYIYETDEIDNAPTYIIDVIEHAYLSGCPQCAQARFSNIGKGSICAKQEGCPHWYDAKKKPYRLVKVDLLKG